MALNKTNIPIAIGHQSEMDLPADHNTSMNFLLGQPVYYRHMPRKEKLNMHMIGTLRPKPLALPTYGRIRNNLRAFFCPYRLVMPNYDAMSADVIASNNAYSSLVTDVPYFTMKTLRDYFLNIVVVGVGPLVTTTGATANHHDFRYNSTYYLYTSIGRRCYKLLIALGYKVLWGGSSAFKYSALALMCYGRIYLDWYANSQYLDSAAVLKLEQLFAYNNPTAPLELFQNDLNVLIRLVFAVTYDSDQYFNHAWDNPVAPSNGQWTLPNVGDITADNVVNSPRVVPQANGTPIMVSGSTQSLLGTQYIHDMLQKLSNYQRRHALSGARQIDRALVDWGFASDYMTLKRSIYIGNHTIDMQIGDVMSHADTSQSPNPSNLGDFAGRGFGQQSGDFEFTSDEDGMLIVISTIIPSCGFTQGYDRNNRHLNKYDFYNANFEVGVQAIEKGEVYVSGDADFVNASEYDFAFGFSGRYGEYKRSISWNSSENAFPSVNNGVDAWTLFRHFDDNSFSGDLDNVVHSLGFARGEDWETYNRIFNYIGSDYDKFDCFYHFDVHTWSPFKPLFETYDFKETHKQIKMDINGSTLN